MVKKVAVQRGLDSLKSELISLGYDVVDMEVGTNAEAIIYMSGDYETLYQNQIINMINGEEVDHNEGALLINAIGKNANEIDTIIKNRIYSTLF